MTRASTGPKLSVLTVDHGLRASSREEAERVGRMASALGLPHAILTWEKAELPSASLQARARTARYDLMAAYCHAHDIPALVTAHHPRRSGRDLPHAAQARQRPRWPRGNSGARRHGRELPILRPLLDVPKARLVATLDDAGLPFVSDPSNADPRFERARMRERTDALEALGLTPEALALSARRLRRAREALDAVARDFLARHSAMSDAGYATIDRAALAAAPQEIALRALAQLIAAVGGGEAPVQLAKLETLLAALEANPDKAHTLGRCRLETGSGRLGLFREVRGGGLPITCVRPGERALWDNRFTIELGAGEAGTRHREGLGRSGFSGACRAFALVASVPRLAGRTLPPVGGARSSSGFRLLIRRALERIVRLGCRARFVEFRDAAQAQDRAPA